MASWTEPVARPTRPLNEMLRLFAKQAEEDMQINMMTQRVWPYEVYKGYSEINERRRKQGGWFSTGEGYRSISVKAETARDITEATIVARFNEYLRYVDIGVGAGRDASQVSRSRKAKHDRRYNAWNVERKRTHRPAFFLAMRHVGTRVRNYAVDFYGYQTVADIIKTWDLDTVVIDI